MADFGDFGDFGSFDTAGKGDDFADFADFADFESAPIALPPLQTGSSVNRSEHSMLTFGARIASCLQILSVPWGVFPQR
jgi:hypothetical protein